MGDVRAPARRPGWWPGWPKRAFDVAAASGALIVLAPLLGVTALAIRLVLGRPVLFAQRRPGRHARPFILYKFRTMSGGRAAHRRRLPGSERPAPLDPAPRRGPLDEPPRVIPRPSG